MRQGKSAAARSFPAGPPRAPGTYLPEMTGGSSFGIFLKEAGGRARRRGPGGVTVASAARMGESAPGEGKNRVADLTGPALSAVLGIGTSYCRNRRSAGNTLGPQAGGPRVDPGAHGGGAGRRCEVRLVPQVPRRRRSGHMVRLAWAFLGLAMVMAAVLAVSPAWATTRTPQVASAEAADSSPTLPIQVVPDPATLALLGTGLALAFAVRHRRRKRGKAGRRTNRARAAIGRPRSSRRGDPARPGDRTPAESGAKGLKRSRTSV